MRIRVLLAAVVPLAATILVSAPMGASATVAGGTGLWPANHTAEETDCNVFSRDANNFCFIDDSGVVELGVKFTTATPVTITGVRVYRVDAGTVTGSLWKTDGTNLASGTFAAQAGHGWQDLIFDAPVAIQPGQTYIASYFAPNAQYAFEYDFFTNSALTVGPITALKSVAGERNGVYCYGDACGLPTDSFRDTNYWVTPLWESDTTPPVVELTCPSDPVLLGAQAYATWTASDEAGGSGLAGADSGQVLLDTSSVGPKTATVPAGTAVDNAGNESLAATCAYSVSYDFDGFFQPVDNIMRNKAKAGSAIPVKFSLGGDLGLDVLAAGYPKVTSIPCESGVAVDAIEETVTAGSSTLTYDAYADQYVYVWKTSKAWANKCYQFELGLNDGTSHTFDVRFVK